MSDNIILFLCSAIRKLNKASTKDFAKLYISLKIEFCHKFQGGMISDTSYGIHFFQSVLDLILANKETPNKPPVYQYLVKQGIDSV